MTGFFYGRELVILVVHFFLPGAAVKSACQDVDKIKSDIDHSENRIFVIDSQISDMAKHRSQYELAMKAKLRVESVLEDLLKRRNQEADLNSESMATRINELSKDLKDNYDIENNMRSASEYRSEGSGRQGYTGIERLRFDHHGWWGIF